MSDVVTDSSKEVLQKEIKKQAILYIARKFGLLGFAANPLIGFIVSKIIDVILEKTILGFDLVWSDDNNLKEIKDYKKAINVLKKLDDKKQPKDLLKKHQDNFVDKSSELLSKRRPV